MMRRIVSMLAIGARVVVMLILDVGRHAFYRLELRGLEHDTGAPRTYLAILHKRDLDPPIPLPAILRHRGWRAIAGDVHFAMRADGFTRGFLARIVAHPRWLAWLFRQFSVGWVLRSVGIHPLVDLRIRPYEEWIRERIQASGDALAGAVLSAAFLRELAAAAHERAEHVAGLLLSQLAAWRYYPVMRLFGGPEIFVPVERRLAERRLVANARRYLDDVAAWLRRDGSIYGSPEGRLTPDGRVSPITGGFHRVMRAAPADTRVLPIAVVYDFMRPGRPRLFVDIAPAIEHAPELARAPLDTALREGWLRAARFTCTQLATGVLVRRASGGDYQREGSTGMGTRIGSAVTNGSPRWTAEPPMALETVACARARTEPVALPALPTHAHPAAMAGRSRPYTRKVVWQAAPFTHDELADDVHRQAQALATAGRHVDTRLLDPRRARRLVADYLAYTVRVGGVRRLGRDLWVPTPGPLAINVRLGDVGYRHAPFAYAWHELREMLAVDAVDAPDLARDAGA